MRIVDLQLSMPAILLALVMVAVLGQGAAQIVLALVVAQYAYFALRTTHGAATVERGKDYIEAVARHAGCPRAVFSLRHLLPNVMPPLIVVATVQVASAIALEATLSFLGVGLPLTEPSLGSLSSPTGSSTSTPTAPGCRSIPGCSSWRRWWRSTSWATRYARSSSPKRDAMTPALEVRGLTTRSRDPRGLRHGGQRRLLLRGPRPHPGPGGRERVGQVRHRLLDHGPDRPAGRGRRGREVLIEGRDMRRYGHRRAQRAHARAQGGDGLPGPDDDAQPRPARGGPDGHGRARPRPRLQARRLGARRRGLGDGRHPGRARRAPARLPPSALRRDAPAGRQSPRHSCTAPR